MDEKRKKQNTRQYKREQLFALYAQNWSIVRRSAYLQKEKIPDIDDAFMCPLCFRIFMRQALLEPEVLTLEHVPPEALGGKNADAILLCKECNNKAGTQLDSQLQTMLNSRDFLEMIPGASAEGKYTFFNDVSVPATISIPEVGALNIDAQSKRSNPKNLARVNSFLDALDQYQSFSWQFSIKTGNTLSAEINLLRIAYLMAFRLFGYGYVMHPNSLAVREQIRNPKQEILPRAWVLHHITFNEKLVGVNVIDIPRELRSFLVIFELKSRLRRHQCAVILPRLDTTGLDIYSWLQSQDGKQISFTHKPIIPKSVDITDPKIAFVSYTYWQ